MERIMLFGADYDLVPHVNKFCVQLEMTNVSGVYESYVLIRFSSQQKSVVGAKRVEIKRKLFLFTCLFKFHSCFWCACVHATASAATFAVFQCERFLFNNRANNCKHFGAQSVIRVGRRFELS